MPKDREQAGGPYFRWSVERLSTGEVVATGCGRYPSRYDGLIQFRGAAGEMFSESQTWEDVIKESETPFTQQQLDDPAWWCADQDGITTLRTPLTLIGETCVATQDANPAATVDAIALISPTAPDAASGRRLMLTVRHTGPLVLNYVQACLMEPTDAFAPPPWTELTILP